MKRLSKEQILMLHSPLIEQTGGTVGVRDFNLLESAIETPFQVFGEEELYPTIQAKGTRLGYGLIKNHCMLDGNKRIGTHVMLVFFAQQPPRMSAPLLRHCRRMSANSSGVWE